MRVSDPRRTQTLREHLTLPPFSAPPPPPALPPPPAVPAGPPLSQGLSSESLGAPLNGPPPQDPQPHLLSRCRVEEGMRPPHGHAPTPRPATVPSPPLPPPPPPLSPPRNNPRGPVNVIGTTPGLLRDHPLYQTSKNMHTHTQTGVNVSESICLTVKLCTSDAPTLSPRLPLDSLFLSPLQLCVLLTQKCLHTHTDTHTQARSCG